MFYGLADSNKIKWEIHRSEDILCEESRKKRPTRCSVKLSYGFMPMTANKNLIPMTANGKGIPYFKRDSGDASDISLLGKQDRGACLHLLHRQQSR